MHFKAIGRIIGVLLMAFSFTLLAPVLIALIYEDGEGLAFVLSFGLSFGVGLCLWYVFHNQAYELRAKEGFLIVGLFWLVLGAASSLPYLFAQSLNLSLVDALFEAYSGLTTTGATILVEIDALPHAILFHRQFSQFVGGMGIIILAIAIIPLLGMEGISLFKAESSGPLKDKKILPRISEIARSLWVLYSLATLICALAFYAAGMNAFDAITHSFSTISNGGFSTHNQSMAYFNSPAIHYIAAFFMLFAGLNFSLHVQAGLKLKSGIFDRSVLDIYRRNHEVRLFIWLQALLILIFSLGIYVHFENYSLSQALQHGTLHMSSMAMTSGFTIFDANNLPPFLAMLTLLAACIGGSAGSTTGGIKLVRLLVLYLQLKKEIKRLIHPNAITSVKLDKAALNPEVLGGIVAFLVIFVLIFWICALGAMLTGMGAFDAIGATFASITNAGPGIGITSGNFADVPNAAKYIFIFAMIAGRLEFFSLIILFVPSFWRS